MVKTFLQTPFLLQPAGFVQHRPAGDRAGPQLDSGKRRADGTGAGGAGHGDDQLRVCGGPAVSGVTPGGTSVIRTVSGRAQVSSFMVEDGATPIKAVLDGYARRQS